MGKWTMNYETGDFEDIERDGFSITTGEYTYDWDDTEYRREEEEEQRREEERRWEEEDEDE